MLSNEEKDLQEDIGGFAYDPYGFVIYSFPWGEKLLTGKKVRKWQKNFLIKIGIKLKKGLTTIQEAIQEAIASGHGIGKSALVAWLILWGMSTFADTRGVVTANTENQLKTKTWAEVGKWHNMMICKHWFTVTATAIFSSNKSHEKTWRIDAVTWSLTNTEAFAGLHNEGKRIILIFDEGSAIPNEIWEVAEGALTDENTEIIWCVFGNPTKNTGRFRECFRKFRHRWGHQQIDSREVEGTNKRQLEKWIEDYGINSDFVKIRVRGIFPTASARQFISTNIVDGARGKHLREDQYGFAPVIIGVDPAWTGDDSLEIFLRQGLMSKHLESIPYNDNDVLIANIVARFEDEHKADAVFIDIGYGTGIHSVGKTLGRTWQLISFGGASADPGCYLKRSEMWNSMKNWLKDGGVIPDIEQLCDDLLGPETVARNDGLIALEPKEAMKKRGIPSPNMADALALTFAMPVVKKEHYHGQSDSYDTDYNPLKRRR